MRMATLGGIGTLTLAVLSGGYLALSSPSPSPDESLLASVDKPIVASADLGSPSKTNESERRPRVAVDQTEYDFGQQTVRSDGSYTFHIRNEGTGPLFVRLHRALERTWHFELADNEVLPGASTRVSVKWKTGDQAEDIVQSALVLTNDPERPQIELFVKGKIRAECTCVPNEIATPDVRPHESTTVATLVHSHLWNGFQIRDLKCSLPDVQVECEAATSEELANQRATSGWWVRATFPAGLKNGRFAGELSWTAVPDDKSVEPRAMSVPLRGRVLRRLAVYGDKIEFTGVVNLGLVPFGEEKKVRLLMKVRDEQLDLPVRNVKVSPDFLQVSVTPAPTTEPDSQGHYYLEIGAPATAPECDFTNSNGRGMGTVSLEFDHPRIPSLDLQVYFTVERRLR